MHWSQRVQKPLSGTFSPSWSLSILNGHTSIQSPHSLQRDGLNSILFRLTFSPLISFSISSTFNAPSGQEVAHAPHRVHMRSCPSPILMASVGHILMHSPLNLHFSSSKISPLPDDGFAGPSSTSHSMASTGNRFHPVLP